MGAVADEALELGSAHPESRRRGPRARPRPPRSRRSRSRGAWLRPPREPPPPIAWSPPWEPPPLTWSAALPARDPPPPRLWSVALPAPGAATVGAPVNRIGSEEEERRGQCGHFRLSFF
ncbi:hypothetical protein PR202_gb00806 [Eleusine coracana subsp. coracana]|uniref:Uncharacterized protein n=1 Tax=Eleusine coracana subsp. coracana TaxID=191504 RepID=A0AAV5DV21_ELECO|nr:hypothetical protein PR202_gb00806 [Eleusine coracana subsp. coracana]